MLGRIILVAIGVGTLAFGVFAFVRPEALARIVQLSATAPAGVTEIRAFYGGVEFGLAAFWIGAGFSRAWLRPGLASAFAVWALVAAARGVGMILDDSMTDTMVMAFAVEAVAAVLALVGLLRTPQPAAASTL